MKFSILMALIATVSGCASINNASIRAHTFTHGNGSQFVIQQQGCGVRSGQFKNNTEKSVSVAQGTLVALQKETHETLVQYLVSCSATVAGGSSKCLVHQMMKDGDDRKYGGWDCPNIDFKLMSVLVRSKIG